MARDPAFPSASLLFVFIYVLIWVVLQNIAVSCTEEKEIIGAILTFA